MKNNVLKVLTALIIGVVVVSCSTSNEVVSKGLFSKRKYNKGFHFNTNKKIKSNTEKTEESILVLNDDIKPEKTNIDLKPNLIFEKTKNNEQKTEYDLASTNKKADFTPKNVSKRIEVLKQINSETLKTSKKNKIAQFKQAKKIHSTSEKKDDVELVLLIILCFVLPPVAVFLHQGGWNGKCTLNLILTLLCGIPGVIHGLIVVLGGK